MALVNPEIIKAQRGGSSRHGGLPEHSRPVGDNVPRHVSVIVKARDPKGKEIRVKAEGWFARILQHEIDHLDGVLYIDRITP